MKPELELINGKMFNYVNPDPNTIDQFVIAHGLSKICRFVGQIPVMYTVAQHSVLASYEVPEEYAFSALMHDASEAFTGDIPTPLKMLIPDFRVIEDRIQETINAKYCLPYKMDPEIKRADIVMLKTEKQHFGKSPWSIDDSTPDILPSVHKIVPWTVEESYHKFLDRFSYLTYGFNDIKPILFPI
jgi:hypothetical protein